MPRLNNFRIIDDDSGDREAAAADNAYRHEKRRLGRANNMLLNDDASNTDSLVQEIRALHKKNETLRSFIKQRGLETELVDYLLQTSAPGP